MLRKEKTWQNNGEFCSYCKGLCWTNGSGRIRGKTHVLSDYCNKPKHTRETCWKLHRKPTNWRETHERRGRLASIHEVETAAFSKEQLDHIQKLLKSNSGLSGTPNTSLAHSGSNPNTFVCHYFSVPWIIDSGASDQMTSLSKFVS